MINHDYNDDHHYLLMTYNVSYIHTLYMIQHYHPDHEKNINQCSVFIYPPRSAFLPSKADPLRILTRQQGSPEIDMKKTKTHLDSDIVCSFSSALNLVALAKKSQSCVRYASGVKIDNLLGLPQDLL